MTLYCQQNPKHLLGQTNKCPTAILGPTPFQQLSGLSWGYRSSYTVYLSCTCLLLFSLSPKPKKRPIPGLIFLPLFFTRIYFFVLDSYIAYLKLHTLVIIFSSTKAQEQTNPWFNILATIRYQAYTGLARAASNMVCICIYK